LLIWRRQPVEHKRRAGCITFDSGESGALFF
jgi:hypothetical protein